MIKPATLAGYSDQLTQDCERVLVTLLRGLGPWKDAVFLIGGLTPRYLVKARPPQVPAHAGTMDVDLVIDLQILTNTEAYATLEQNLERRGFERGENNKGVKVSWRWKTRTEHGAIMVVELLTDAPDLRGGRVQELPTAGTISALNIPHSSIVFDMHEEIEIQADLLGGGGLATERVRHANLVSFTCLKAFAFDERAERKDAHDLVYCLENTEGGMEAVAAQFIQARGGKHGQVVQNALQALRARFASETGVEGYRKDGPVAVARFELGEGEQPELREARLLRQRQVNDLIERLLAV